MKTRVLFLAPYLPRPNALHAGGTDSAFYLSTLLERCDVDLICLGTVRDRREARAVWPAVGHLECIPYRQGVMEKLEGVAEDLLRPGHWGRGARFRFREAVRIRTAGTRYDVLHVEHQETDFWFDETHVPVRFIDLHDVVSGLLEKGASANPCPDSLPDLAAARDHEADLLRRYHRVTVRSAAERDRLAVRGDGGRIAIVRHPVNPPAGRVPRAGRIPGRVLLTGSFYRPANQVAARELAGSILPLIVAACPDATLMIAGAGADRTLAELARDRRILVQGVLPELGEVYNESMVFVNPLRCGGGVITRHLESLARGLPVVTVPAGAEGLDMARGFQAAESPEDLAALTIRLLNDAGHWETCSLAGFEGIGGLHAPSRVRESLFALYDGVLGPRSHV